MSKIAALPMYDWPETKTTNDALWEHFRTALLSEGFEAPATLTRGNKLEHIWLSDDLFLAQTCSYPLETILRSKVRYVATPSYKAEGCEKKGHYRSVIVRRGSLKNAGVPSSGQAFLPEVLPYEKIAVNGMDSMSGYHAFQRDAAKAGLGLPKDVLLTGSHRASIIAVAEGLADLAAIDCVSWAMAQKYEAASNLVYVAGWTNERPGLPLITSLNSNDQLVAALRAASYSVFEAVDLYSQIEV
ncbi:MAG: phosphate/phosphite/phosphonate ABC transporter substrate-binding protein [Notoacmeibacter sp.]